MMRKFQGAFLAITLLLGVSSIPLGSTFGFNQAYAVEVGAKVETEIEVKVGSDDNSTKTETKGETKSKAEVKSESEMKHESEIKIKVHVVGNQTTIEIEMNGEEKTHVLNTSSDTEIIAKIKSETSLSETKIRSIWEYKSESDTKARSSEKTKLELESKIEAKLAGIANANLKAKERAKILVSSIEDNSTQTDKRVHAILLKAKAEGYFGNKPTTDASMKSFGLVLDGMAQSQSKTDSSLKGTMYLESMGNSNLSKYKISGGQIMIGDQSYDVLFGKARSTSNSQIGSNMILLAEVMKPNGEITTMKILMKTDSSVNSQTESSTWSVMNPQSKIAGSWKMDATATMSVVSA